VTSWAGGPEESRHNLRGTPFPEINRGVLSYVKKGTGRKGLSGTLKKYRWKRDPSLKEPLTSSPPGKGKKLREEVESLRENGEQFRGMGASMVLQ